MSSSTALRFAAVVFFGLFFTTSQLKAGADEESLILDPKKRLKRSTSGHLSRTLSPRERRRSAPSVTSPTADLAEIDQLLSERELPKLLRILIVDDGQIHRKILTRMLGHFKRNRVELHIFEACDGEEAVKILEENIETLFDIAIFDKQMGEGNKDGGLATREWRTIEREKSLPKLPIIMFSTCADPAEIEKCKEYGVQEFLQKNVSTLKMLTTILDLLEAKGLEI